MTEASDDFGPHADNSYGCVLLFVVVVVVVLGTGDWGVWYLYLCSLALRVSGRSKNVNQHQSNRYLGIGGLQLVPYAVDKITFKNPTQYRSRGEVSLKDVRTFDHIDKTSPRDTRPLFTARAFYRPTTEEETTTTEDKKIDFFSWLEHQKMLWDIPVHSCKNRKKERKGRASRQIARRRFERG